jgi:hypothetical protein
MSEAISGDLSPRMSLALMRATAGHSRRSPDERSDIRRSLSPHVADAHAGYSGLQSMLALMRATVACSKTRIS